MIILAKLFNRPLKEYSRIAIESDAWTASDINKEYRRLFGILRKRYQRMVASRFASTRMRTKMASLMQFTPSSFEKTARGVKNPKKVSALSELANILNKKSSSILGMSKDIARKVATLHKTHPDLTYIDESNFLDYVEIVQGFSDSHEKNFKYDILEEDIDLIEITGKESARFVGQHLDEFRNLMKAKNDLQNAVSKFNRSNSSTESIIFYNDELSEYYNSEFSGFTKKTVDAMSKITAEDIAEYFIEKHRWPEEILDFI